jgi:hypothetical protein
VRVRVCVRFQTKVRDLEEKCRSQSEQFGMLSHELDQFRVQTSKVDLASTSLLSSPNLSVLTNGVVGLPMERGNGEERHPVHSPHLTQPQSGLGMVPLVVPTTCILLTQGFILYPHEDRPLGTHSCTMKPIIYAIVSLRGLALIKPVIVF